MPRVDFVVEEEEGDDDNVESEDEDVYDLVEEEGQLLDLDEDGNPVRTPVAQRSQRR